MKKTPFVNIPLDRVTFYDNFVCLKCGLINDKPKIITKYTNEEDYIQITSDIIIGIQFFKCRACLKLQLLRKITKGRYFVFREKTEDDTFCYDVDFK